LFIIHCQTERNKSKIYSNGIRILKLFWYFFYNKKSKTYIWFLEINIYKISIKRNKIIKKVSKQKTKNCFFRALKNCSFFTVMVSRRVTIKGFALAWFPLGKQSCAKHKIITLWVIMLTPLRIKIFDFKISICPFAY